MFRRKTLMGRHPPQQGIKGDAIARSPSAKKNTVNVIRFKVWSPAKFIFVFLILHAKHTTYFWWDIVVFSLWKARVGCTSGCRCLGCKNDFGKKEGKISFLLFSFNKK